MEWANSISGDEVAIAALVALQILCTYGTVKGYFLKVQETTIVYAEVSYSGYPLWTWIFCRPWKYSYEYDGKNFSSRKVTPFDTFVWAPIDEKIASYMDSLVKNHSGLTQIHVIKKNPKISWIYNENLIFENIVYLFVWFFMDVAIFLVGGYPVFGRCLGWYGCPVW